MKGTARPVYNRGPGISISVWPHSGVTDVSDGIDHQSGVGTAADETTTYYMADRLGSERMMTSAQGYPVWQAIYSPFGIEVSPQITPNVWKFAGTQVDGETGLNAAEFRQYSSTVHRWLSPDPLGGSIMNPQSLNRYTYAPNSPTNLTDPMGLESGEPFGPPPDRCDDPYYADTHGECQSPGRGGEACDAEIMYFAPMCGRNSDLLVWFYATLRPVAPPPPKGCSLYGNPLQCAGITMPGGEGLLSGDYGPTGTLSLWQIFGPSGGVGVPGNGFGAGALAIPVAEGLGGLVCVGSGACEVALTVAAAIAAGVAVYKGIETGVQIYQSKKHRKGKRGSTWDKHTKPRPGRETTKDRRNPGWKPRTPPRPQEIVPNSN